MKILALLVSIVSFSVLVGAADKSEQVASVGVVYTDDGTFEADIVRYGDKTANTYLVKISGVDSDSDGKVFKVTENGGSTGPTYYEKENGKNLLRAPAHAVFGWEAYVDGKTFKIDKNQAKTKELKTSDILKDFKNQNK
jgi:hypothetical protein